MRLLLPEQRQLDDLLDLYDLGDNRRTQRIKTAERCSLRVAALARQRDDIDTTINELNDFITLLHNQPEE